MAVAVLTDNGLETRDAPAPTPEMVSVWTSLKPLNAADAGTIPSEQELGAAAAEALGAEIIAVSANIEAARAHRASLIARMEAGMGWLREGAASMADWLSWKCGMSKPEGAREVRVALAMQTLPATAAAFAKGEISASKVRAVARMAAVDPEAPAGTVADADAELLEQAIHSTASQLDRLAAGVERALRKAPDQGDAPEARAWRDEHGRVHLKGVFSGGEAEAVELWLERAREALFPKKAEAAEHLSRDQQRGLALLRAMEVDLGRLAEGKNDDRYLVTIYADVAALLGGQGLVQSVRSGYGLDPEYVRRLLCDQGIVPMRIEGDGETARIGRKRRAPTTALERLVRTRDGGMCRGPGCERRIDHIHHIWHWLFGGPTDADNLVGLCFVCHHKVHEGGWKVVGKDDDGRLILESPDKVIVRHQPPLTEGSVEAVEQLNRAAGLDIDGTTGVARWDGAGLDLDWAVAAVCERVEVSARRAAAARAAAGPDAGPPGEGRGSAPPDTDTC